MRKLEGRVALVTGSTKNIGRAIALALAELGANVVVHGRSDRQAVEATARELEQHDVRTLSITGDVADYDEVQRMVSEIRGKLGPVEILVSNAAIRPGSPFEDMTPEQWRTVLGVNLDATFHLCKAVVPDMLSVGRGSIITISGPAAYGTSPDRAHVAAAKAGLIGLSKALAREYAHRNVRVNCVVPSSIGTERRHPEWYSGPDFSSAEYLQRIPLGRLGRPEEVAALCAFLATDDAGYITRQVIRVNGGAYV